MAVQTVRSLLGIPPSKPTTKDSVLVIIDAQGEYVNGYLKVKNIENSRAVIKSLLDAYRAAGGSIVHVIIDLPNGSPIFTPDTELAEILPELKPVNEEPIVKKVHASAFTGTNFKEVLDATGKKSLVITGYMVHNCVSATARAAAELGYDVSIISDAVGDRDIPNASANDLVRVALAEVADAVATIIDSKSLL